MFPKHSLMLGTSLLWSVTPLVASPLTGGREDLQRVLAEKSANELLNKVRSEIASERTSEAFQVFDGLLLMFERGDHRVMIIPEFHSPTYCDGVRYYPPADRVRSIVNSHIDLYDEALSLV